MALGEFQLIQQFFARPSARKDIHTGIGDDAAVTVLGDGETLVTTVDTLVAGVHFPHQTSAADIGYKSLAVSLSDLAAMSAVPCWFTLAMTVPESDPEWLAQFAAGLFEAAQESGIALIGGDTTRGPLTITIQAMGSVPSGQAVLRSGARDGDDIYISGTPGEAAYGLALLQERMQAAPATLAYMVERLNRPTARTELGLALRSLASAMIDCSDGIAADLGHILEQSGVGASLSLMDLPKSWAMQALEPQQLLPLILHGGDDYELIFTANRSAAKPIAQVAQELSLPLTRIGQISAEPSLRCRMPNGAVMPMPTAGYQHFSGTES